jgi:site-specific recombinase XerD
MAAMRPPVLPDAPPAVFTDAQLTGLLRACEGRDLPSRRDTAILRLLLDTGMRRAEIAGLKVEDVDLAQNLAYVVGKGRRPRVCPFGRKTAQALDRYLRVRSAHPQADTPHLWLGLWGPMTPNGIYQVVRTGRRRRAWAPSTRTSSATPSPTRGWRPAGRKAT